MPDERLTEVDSGDDLRRTLEKAALEVGLPEDRAGDMKVSYLRDGGREAEIWDGQSAAEFTTLLQLD